MCLPRVAARCRQTLTGMAFPLEVCRAARRSRCQETLPSDRCATAPAIPARTTTRTPCLLLLSFAAKVLPSGTIDSLKAILHERSGEVYMHALCTAFSPVLCSDADARPVHLAAGLPVDRQQLLFASQQLHGSHVLSHYGVEVRHPLFCADCIRRVALEQRGAYSEGYGRLVRIKG